jgi:hypothetical protein
MAEKPDASTGGTYGGGGLRTLFTQRSNLRTNPRATTRGGAKRQRERSDAGSRENRENTANKAHGRGAFSTGRPSLHWTH